MALPASVIAEPGHDRRPGQPGIPPGMDSNGDAAISRSEFEASTSRHFVEADRDGDGQLTREEVAAAEQARHEREQARRQHEHFRRMDTDADGIVDSAEFSAMAVGHFDHMDANGDGLVDASEWRPPGPPPPRDRPAAWRAAKAQP
jgi:hypothetical protein